MLKRTAGSLSPGTLVSYSLCSLLTMAYLLTSGYEVASGGEAKLHSTSLSIFQAEWSRIHSKHGSNHSPSDTGRTIEELFH